MSVLAILAPLLFTASPAVAHDTVNISLFSLFKPETLNIRVASGEAILDAGGIVSSLTIARGEIIRIRLSNNRLTIVVAGLHGGVNRNPVATEARITPSDSATLELIIPGKIRRHVRGSVSVDGGPAGRGPLRILLKTDRESAIASVVAAEMSTPEMEALKTLAVLVRTYMRSHSGRHSREGFDFCDTTHCQLYKGEQDLSDGTKSPAAVRAVTRTAGQVLSFRGRVIDGYYSAACGGMSVTPSMVWGGDENDYPYSRIACSWCRASRFSRWERSASALRVLQSLSTFLGVNLSSTTELIVEPDQPTGFVRSVVLRDAGRQRELTVDAFRRAIGLQLGWNTVLSPTFTVERRAARFIFRGRGFGSQVGLCEAGALAQAAAGRSYREILRFYYPSAEIADQPAHE